MGSAVTAGTRTGLLAGAMTEICEALGSPAGRNQRAILKPIR